MIVSTHLSEVIIKDVTNQDRSSWIDIMNRLKWWLEYDRHWPTLYSIALCDLINLFDLVWLIASNCLLYFNTCVPTGWSCVIVPKGWASWLVARLVTWWCSPKGTLFISRLVKQTLLYFPNCPYGSARLLTYCAAWLVAGNSAHFDKSMPGRIPLRHGTRGFLLQLKTYYIYFSYFYNFLTNLLG